MIVSPYDAELYGHWWFEGPLFLNDLFRQLHFDQAAVESITPGDYLERHPTNQVATPSFSSWGANGYAEHLCNETNAWMYRHAHVAAERMVELAHRNPSASGLERRALNQAARELLLAQSSDWAFIMKTATAVKYACDRVKAHLARFRRIDRELSTGAIDEGWLRGVESRDNIFPEVDYRVYLG